MILEALVGVIVGLLYFILSPLPALPSFPTAITDGFESFLDLIIGQPIAVVAYIFGTPLAATLVSISLAVAVFFAVYRPALWVYHKIRG